MAALIEDLVEDILLRLDNVEDLTRYKVVCKSWNSLISTHRFAKAHLKQQQQQHHTSRRISFPSFWKVPNQRLFKYNCWQVVGSSNGLAVFFFDSPCQILVNNPCTRELRKLPMPTILTKLIKPKIFGFGYDSSTDDFKVVMGAWDHSIQENHTLFQVLSLKSNTWKFIGVFKYGIFYGVHGILFDGALHWLATDHNKKRVFLSFDLSREEFTAKPVDHSGYGAYGASESYVGIVDDTLCIFVCPCIKEEDIPCNNVWVMRSCKGERSWEKLPDNSEMKYQVVHYMKNLELVSSNNIRISFFCDDNKCLSRVSWFHLKSPLFVPSLVSPYAGTPSHDKNNRTSCSLEVIRRDEGQLLQPSIRRGIIKGASEKEEKEIEAVYRWEVGETENFYVHEEGYREIKETVTRMEGARHSLCKGVKK